MQVSEFMVQLLQVNTHNMPALAPALLRQIQEGKPVLMRMLVSFKYSHKTRRGKRVHIVNKGNVLHRQDTDKWKAWCKAHNKVY